MIQKLVLAMALAITLIACGTSKSASVPDKPVLTVNDGDDMITIAEPDISQAEIDSLQHAAARKAMEEGEFILLGSYVTSDGKGSQVIPRFNFIEVTDGKIIYQFDRNPKRQPRRSAFRTRNMKYQDNKNFQLSITPGSLTGEAIIVSLYPGSNRATATFTWATVEGIILPHKAAVSLITKSSEPSYNEQFDSLN